MSDTYQDAHSPHPEEMLAVYVDGSASGEERRTVEAHVAACDRCRSEVQLAMSARAALVSLPELDAPGLAAARLDAFRPPVGQPSKNASIPDLATARQVRDRPRLVHWDRLALGAGLAAAAGLFIIFAVISLTKHTNSTAGLSKANSAATGLPRVIDRGATYSSASLQTLADQLRVPAQRGETLSRPPAGAPFEQNRTANNPAAGSITPTTSQIAVLTCLQSASGLGPAVKPFYLEAADFQGTPAFIGAFVIPPAASGAPSHLLLVAASRNGCQPLFVVRQSL